jgi:hypothetical protein
MVNREIQLAWVVVFVLSIFVSQLGVSYYIENI